jgi:hypothetical protein
MSQPPAYSPATDFSAEEANNQGGRSTVRTAQLDAEFAAIDVTLDALLTNLAIIQRDDGEIRDGKVKLHTLADDVKTLLATTGCVVRGAWLTSTNYAAKDIVSNGGVTYICAAVHTSGTFATDLAAGKWLNLSTTLAADVSFTPQAGIAATTVSAALAEIGNQIGDGAGGMGFRNRLINGDMRIDQRNGGAAVTVNAASTIYGVDRWYGYGQPADGVFTMTRTAVTSLPGFTHCLRFQTTTADASIGAAQIYIGGQKIEGYNIGDLDFGLATAKTVTLSFWVRSSLTGTFGGSLGNNSNRAYPFSFAINQANTWEYKTVTVAGDTTGTYATDSNAGLVLALDLGCGTTSKGTAGAWSGTYYYGVTGGTNLIGTLNATLDLAGVQLEVGSVATPFERRSYSVELAMCQRYCYVGGYFATYVTTNQTSVYGPAVQFPTTMRASPTVTLPSSTNAVYDNLGNPATPDIWQGANVNAANYSIRADRAAGIRGWPSGTLTAVAEL